MNNLNRQKFGAGEFIDAAWGLLLFGLTFISMETEQSYYLSIDSDTILSRRFDSWGFSSEDIIVDKSKVSDYNITRVDFWNNMRHTWNVCAYDQLQKSNIVLFTSRNVSISERIMNYISKNDSGWLWIPSGNIVGLLLGMGLFSLGVVMFVFDFIKQRDKVTRSVQNSLGDCPEDSNIMSVQNQYDEETDYGRNSSKQDEWGNKDEYK